MCKHENGLLTEYCGAVHQRELRNGKLDDFGYNNMDDILYYRFSCWNCGRTWKFQPTTKVKWLRALYEQLRTGDTLNIMIEREGANNSYGMD